MLKEEFEQLIGKEVDWNTFKMYEAMYSATPENITKQKFVELLNIKVIPENSEAITRREERSKYITEIKGHIKNLEQDLKIEKEDMVRYKKWSKEDPYWKVSFKVSCKRTQELQSEIRQLKSLL